LQVSAERFASRLEALAWERCNSAWHELGDEDCIAVHTEARYDLSFWTAGE